jgi:ornithine racemase
MEIIVDRSKIRDNISTIRSICETAGLKPVWITKGCQAHPDLLSMLGPYGDDTLGDVRSANLKRIRATFGGPLMQVNIPSRGQIDETVRLADVTLISHPVHAQWIDNAARRAGKRHDVLLMVDVGNRREGAMPRAGGAMAEAIDRLAHVRLAGLGTSVGCYGGYRACRADLERLVQVAGEAERAVGHPLPVISAGSGTMLLALARRKGLPPRVNQLRIGAAVWVGEMPPTRTPIAGLHQDAFLFRGEILESGVKPSLPAEATGTDAFGRKVVFENHGDRHLILMNFGVVDTDPYDLTPRSPGVRIVGATSNYTICDVTDAAVPAEIGSALTFRMGYSAMARAMSSPDTVKRMAAETGSITGL